MKLSYCLNENNSSDKNIYTPSGSFSRKNMAKVSKKIIKGMKKYSRCKARQEKTGEGEVNFYLRQLRRRVLTFWTTSVLLIAG